jgi:hypothetical protein
LLQPLLSVERFAPQLEFRAEAGSRFFICGKGGRGGRGCSVAAQNAAVQLSGIQHQRYQIVDNRLVQDRFGDER